MKVLITLSMGMWLMATMASAQPLFESDLIFQPTATTPDHVHASCLVECPNGDLLAVWYENGDPLPSPPFWNENGDKSDNVRIGGSRKAAGASEWAAPFVADDTFGASDNNPCMVIDNEERLWLFRATLIGVPDHTWGSALLRFNISSDYTQTGVPVWRETGILLPRPVGLEAVVRPFLDDPAKAEQAGVEPDDLQSARDGLANSLLQRLGWMPRAHPLVLSDGRLLVPLANENFMVAAMAFTADDGKSWTLSNPVPGMALEQPTVVEFADGTLSAWLRNYGVEHRIKRTDSTDGGMTWSPAVLTDLPHPGAGIEALLLDNGHLLMIYNDLEDGRHSLAVSISTDRGATWQWTRRLENTPGGRFDYPSVIQSRDGTIHATYSYNLKTVKHVQFNEEWVRVGD